MHELVFGSLVATYVLMGLGLFRVSLISREPELIPVRSHSRNGRS